jgi:hypothetical protein
MQFLASIRGGSALGGDNPARSGLSRASWLQELLTEARRAAQAGQRYMLLRYSDPAELALHGINREDIQRSIFVEFYAEEEVHHVIETRPAGSGLRF